MCEDLSDSFVSITRGHKHDPLIENKRHPHEASNRGAVHSETDSDSFVLLLRLFVLSLVYCACIAAMYLHCISNSAHIGLTRVDPVREGWWVVFCVCE